MGPEHSERYSSLHNDITNPLMAYEEGAGEYIDYPKRREVDPDHPELTTPLQRLEQFNINFDELRQQGIEPKDLTPDLVNELLAKIVQQYGETVVGAFFDKYMSPGKGNPDLERRYQSAREMLEEYRGWSQWGVEVVTRGQDIKSDQLNFLLELEGMDIVTSISQVQDLFNAGVRIFAPQYNKDNGLATVQDGLSVLGRQVIHYLFSQGGIVDMAHSSPKTRQDIMDQAEELGAGHLLSYTHGSTPEDALAPYNQTMANRFITQPEIARVARLGGIIGLGVTKPFFRSANELAQRIDQLTQLENGIDTIAIGTDFGGIWRSMLLEEIPNLASLENLGAILSEQCNLDDETIRKVLTRNATEWAKRALIQS